MPSNWQIEGFGKLTYFKAEEESGFYRRKFTVPAGWDDRHVIIRFEGVAYGFEFWINGQKAGSFNSAFNRSDFDITKLIHRDRENIIAVGVGTRSKGYEFDTFDVWGLAGIYRDVTLLGVRDVHVKDLLVTITVADDQKSAEVSIRVDVESYSQENSGARIQLRLKDPAGRQVANAVINAR